MFCKNCGQEIPDNSSACPNCNTAVEVQAETVDAQEVSQSGAGTQAGSFNANQGSTDTQAGSFNANQGSVQGAGNTGAQGTYNAGAGMNNAQQNTYNAGGQTNFQQGYTQNNQYGAPQGNGGNSNTMAIVAYITWIGLIIAAVSGDRNDPFLKFHLNQALIIFLFALLSLIPFVGWIWGIFMCVCWVIGLIGAIQGNMNPVPLIGKITLIK